MPVQESPVIHSNGLLMNAKIPFELLYHALFHFLKQNTKSLSLRLLVSNLRSIILNRSIENNRFMRFVSDTGYGFDYEPKIT